MVVTGPGVRIGDEGDRDRVARGAAGRRVEQRRHHQREGASPRRPRDLHHVAHCAPALERGLAGLREQRLEHAVLAPIREARAAALDREAIVQIEDPPRAAVHDHRRVACVEHDHARRQAVEDLGERDARPAHAAELAVDRVAALEVRDEQVAEREIVGVERTAADAAVDHDAREFADGGGRDLVRDRALGREALRLHELAVEIRLRELRVGQALAREGEAALDRRR